MSGTLTSIVLMQIPWFVDWVGSNSPRRRLGGIDAVFLDCFGDLRRRQGALVRQRLQRGDDNVVAVDLEEPAQFFTRVGASEAIGAQHDITAWHDARIWSANART